MYLALLEYLPVHCMQMKRAQSDGLFLGISRLMEQLPRANVVLLRYLFGVLHSIEKQSEDNKMTAYNLSVCITPSLLWPPTTASPGAEGEFTKKVNQATVLLRYILTFIAISGAKMESSKDRAGVNCLSFPYASGSCPKWGDSPSSATQIKM